MDPPHVDYVPVRSTTENHCAIDEGFDFSSTAPGKRYTRCAEFISGAVLEIRKLGHEMSGFELSQEGLKQRAVDIAGFDVGGDDVFPSGRS